MGLLDFIVLELAEALEDLDETEQAAALLTVAVVELERVITAIDQL